MKVDGYKIQHSIRELEARRKVLAAQFTDSITHFEDENVEQSPEEFMSEYDDSERKIARLQVFQARYNLAVTVEVQGIPCSLHEAVKRVGGAGRIEKMWRSVASPKQDRYAYGPATRNKNEIRAVPTISRNDALKKVITTGRFASAIRAAISKGNATEVEFEDLDASLFE